MSAPPLRDLLLEPGTFLARAVERRRFWPPLVFGTLAALLFTALAVPRVDFEKAAADALDRKTEQVTPHDREEALATAHRLGVLGSYAGAVAGTGLAAVLSAFALWLAFKVVGGAPGLPGSLTVVAWGLVPGALQLLLSIPALLTRPRVLPEDLARLLPASLGALAPGAKGPLAALLWSVDLFSLWSVALVAVGMAAVAGVSTRRAGATVAALWIAYVAVFRMALPALGGPS